jgi:porin
MMAHRKLRLACVTAGVLLGAWPAHAQVPAPGNYDSDMLGAMGGVRPALAAHGLSLTVTDTSEVLGNPTGGLRQATVFEGMGFASLSLDGGKAGLPWDGFSALVSAWIYGRGLSGDALHGLDTISNVEADRSLRLFEMWIEQSFLQGKISVRIGQQSADQEFIVDQYAAVLENGDYGFPDLPSNDLPSGGPAYPFGTPAVRVKVAPSDSVTLLAALFNGDPAPPAPANGPADDPQGRDNSGTNFRIDGGALWFAELQYARNQGDNAPGLPAQYKIGGWYHSSPFADQRLDTLGVSLASSASNGKPLMRHGDFSLYALVDQTVWKSEGGPSSVGVFLRCIGAPSDRNLVDYSVEGGMNWQAPFASRPNDTAALGFEWVRVSDSASELDGDRALYSGHKMPVRRWEAEFELTYQAQVVAGWQVQPDIQYVVRPGGGIPDPADPARRVGDELVLGLRSILTF